MSLLRRDRPGGIPATAIERNAAATQAFGGKQTCIASSDRDSGNLPLVATDYPVSSTQADRRL